MQRRILKSDFRTRRKLIKLIGIVTSILVVCALALFEYLCPFRSLLPAEKVSARAEGELRLHFLYAGTGDCTVVEFPEGDLLVVDGGDGAFGSDVCRYIKGLDGKSISVVATNPGYGHVGGLAELVSAFDVGEVYLPAIGAGTGSYLRFVGAAEKAGCELKTLSRYGVVSRPSGAYLVCLSPYSVDETDKNDASTVLYLEYEGVRALLCSDMTAAREERLLREYALDGTIFNSKGFEVSLPQIDILKVAAHGAATSSSEEWLSLLSAKTAILSCGRGSGNFLEATARRLAGSELYRTDELGTIVVTIRDGDFRVLTKTE